MNSYNIDYQKLSQYGDKVKAGRATKQEKDEFMYMLYLNGNITKKQYDDYLANLNSDEIMKTALSVGAVILIGYLLSKIFASK